MDEDVCSFCETFDSCCREPLCGLLKVVATECEKLLLDGTPPPTCPFFLAKNSQCVWTKKKCQTTCQLIQPLVGLSNWGPAYCQETCLMPEKSRMPRLCILNQDWHFFILFALNSSSPTFGFTLCDVIQLVDGIDFL